MTGRAPSRDERALWRAATRDVAPLPDIAAPPVESPVAETPPPQRRAPASRDEKRPAAKTQPDLAPDAAPGLDRRSAERLRRGELRIEARLDLHGMTQHEAHRALDDFLARMHQAGRRCVLVITGKGGRASGDGVLRAAVPRWLNLPGNRPLLLAFAPAQPKHGGAGALYLLLRRQR
jgi:DNA-nicking Smr family endonuclease